MSRKKKPKKTQKEIWEEVRQDPEKLKYFRFNWAKNALRLASYRWPGRFNVKQRNYITVPITLKSGKQTTREMCFCDLCGIINIKKFFQIDHLEPCVPLDGWRNFDDYIEKMMCLEEQQRVICKPCHKDVTNAQNEQRRINKKS